MESIFRKCTLCILRKCMGSSVHSLNGADHFPFSSGAVVLEVIQRRHPRISRRWHTFSRRGRRDPKKERIPTKRSWLAQSAQRRSHGVRRRFLNRWCENHRLISPLLSFPKNARARYENKRAFEAHTRRAPHKLALRDGHESSKCLIILIFHRKLPLDMFKSI